MSLKKNILLVLAIVTMCLMLLFIVIGENGISDLYRLKEQKENLSQKKHDPRYVEDVARKELGVIGKDEVIIKVKPKPSDSDKDRKIKK